MAGADTCEWRWEMRLEGWYISQRLACNRDNFGYVKFKKKGEGLWGSLAN